MSIACTLATLGLNFFEASATANQTADKQRPKLIAEVADDQGECGENVEYKFTASTGELRIYGTGNMDKHPWSEYRNDIESVVIENGVTNIVNEAFRYCTSLKSVTIPNSVTSIRRYAFSDCTNLTSIIMPDGLTSIEEWTFSNLF